MRQYNFFGFMTTLNSKYNCFDFRLTGILSQDQITVLIEVQPSKGQLFWLKYSLQWDNCFDCRTAFNGTTVLVAGKTHQGQIKIGHRTLCELLASHSEEEKIMQKNLKIGAVKHSHRKLKIEAEFLNLKLLLTFTN